MDIFTTVYLNIPSVRADVLMTLIAKDIPFNITRTKFFDENLNEI